MPARDYDHDHVRRALIRDGWTITHDPLRLRWGGRDMYALYHDVLLRTESDRELYVAVRDVIYADFFDEPIGRLMIDNHRLKLVVYNPTTEVIQAWTPEIKTAPSSSER